MNNYYCITTIPTNDGNFISALKRATSEELDRAIKYFGLNPHHNKLRRLVVEREIKRRNKEAVN